MTDEPESLHGATRPATLAPALVVGLITFSFSPILVRLASDAPGLAVAVWRTAFAVLVLAPFAMRRAWTDVVSLTGRERLLIVVAGVLLAGHFVTWIESLYLTSVASASVLVAMSPIVLAALGFMLLGEKLSLPVVVSIIGGVIGATIIGFGDAASQHSAAPNPLLGNALATGATLLFSFYFIIGRVVRQRVDWLAYVFPVYVVVAVSTLAFALLRGVPLLGHPPLVYVFCALMALGPQIAGHGSFNFAVKYVPATLLGLLSLTEPMGASVIALILFDEWPGAVSLGGMAIVLVSVASALLFARRRKKLVSQPPS